MALIGDDGGLGDVGGESNGVCCVLLGDGGEWRKQWWCWLRVARTTVRWAVVVLPVIFRQEQQRRRAAAPPFSCSSLSQIPNRFIGEENVVITAIPNLDPHSDHHQAKPHIAAVNSSSATADQTAVAGSHGHRHCCRSITPLLPSPFTADRHPFFNHRRFSSLPVSSIIIMTRRHNHVLNPHNCTSGMAKMAHCGVDRKRLEMAASEMARMVVVDSEKFEQEEGGERWWWWQCTFFHPNHLLSIGSMYQIIDG